MRVLSVKSVGKTRSLSNACTTTIRPDDEIQQFETMYYENFSRTSQLIKLKSVQVTAAPPSAGPSNQQRVKLPSIELPSFNGTLADWLAFWDMLASLIQTNNTLKRRLDAPI